MHVVSVCPPPSALITSGMIWCDIGYVRLVKQVSWLFPAFNYVLIMILAVNKMDGCGHINTARRERLSKKTKVMQCYSYKRITGKTKCFIYISEWANA